MEVLAVALGTRVAFVDDDASFAESMASWLQAQGYEVASHTDPGEGLAAIRDGNFAIAIVDLWMPGHDGIGFVRQLVEQGPGPEIVVLTGAATVDTAVQALKLGVYDYITKPVEPLRLANVLRSAAEKWSIAQRARLLQIQVDLLNSELKQRFGYHALIGKSSVMQQVYDRVTAASKTRGTILIRGESGTGKELVARALHHSSTDRPFVPVNCAALPRDLVEAELFGHRRGAFTNAEAPSDGLFLAASGGTLFLDEVTEMAPEAQAKLLRALQERRVRPVGSATEVPVDVRVIASTNRDPREAIAGGKLREDLFYRLSAATIELPPLRARSEDIPLLVQHFIKRSNENGGRPVSGIERAALAALSKYSWPGNVRELENAIEHACTFGTQPDIAVSDLPAELASRAADHSGLRFEGIVTLQQAEQMAIQNALDRLGGNKSEVARALGISRKHLYSKLARLSPTED